ncbi:hypothetical protein XMM379_003083 [Aliiroseovarius sp. xm-m-379]|uniref:YaaC family protein n=1 Tax=unclassified Aliiroseovarius TaxID=2623558 RepID=UPI00156A44D8|nr:MULTISPECIES: YaaC family protein [unclassified Aliiroseovarius]NRP11482.1 hypothetical protein [Aliiroseovarius sp. xm-d-517]NRP26367.1 hypothetical protein [Aliiroseovarius sp. xm-m-379]NRP32066.1 hypothetical protein [Aliiroseovarius sp. xm-m-314]NRP35155.1 hypothetical protein [Aliiroseovarius sp. xm-a-104]NRP42727.1 hypothetical protein [Aliiroseovarius sp. xm-m-339-2]
MLEGILQDFVKVTVCSNEPLFDTNFPFEENKEKHREVASQFGNLTPEERSSTSFGEFLSRNGVEDPKAAHLIPAKNYSLVQSEARKRVEDGVLLNAMPIDTMDFERSLVEIAESIENTRLIREMYRLRKRTCGQGAKDGISEDEAAKLRHCLIQGRELYSAGLSGSLLVKPLNFFYALTAYAYGVIVLNNPMRFHKGMLPGSHAMNYLPNDFHVQFGGDEPRGTFSDLFTAFPTQHIIGSDHEFIGDYTNSIVEFYEKKHTVSVGTLLSMMPEMAEFYRLSTGRPSRAHPLEISQTSSRKGVKWNFKIGNGERKPDSASIHQAFDSYPVSESYGRVNVEVSVEEVHTIKATIYTDLRGNLWFIENPFGSIQLPEICLHFLTLFCYSNIMRYRPDEWGALVNNEASSDVSLLTRHYFSVLEKKFYALVLRSLSPYYPYAID